MSAQVGSAFDPTHQSQHSGREAVCGKSDGRISAERQNLARKRALEFGQTDLTDSRHGHPYGDELVVSTQATESEIASSLTTSFAPSTPPATGAEGEPASPKFTLRAKLSSLVDSALDHKPRGFFADQFENESNYWAHYKGTGPEILRQTGGSIDAFVSGAGGFPDRTR